MSELEKMLKDILLAGVGAVSTVIDKGGEIAQALVKKGRETMAENQETLEQLKQKAKDACETLTRIDVRALTEAQRQDLKRQLQELEDEMAEAGAKEAEEKQADEAETADGETAPTPEEASAQEAIDALKRAADQLRRAMEDAVNGPDDGSL